MPESVLVPATPTINQGGDSPEEIARVTANMQQLFDKVSPKIRGTPTPESEKVQNQSVQTPTAPVQPATPPSEQTPQPTTQSQEPQQSTPPPVDTESTTVEHKVPSFIEKALSTDSVKPESREQKAETEDLPEELPEFKTPEESKNNWRQFREKYKALKKETEQLRSKPAVDESLTQKLSYLETQNKEMSTQLSRMGVEHHQEFQQKIIQPMQASWNEASRIVHEAGGDPKDLQKALSLSGKAQYEALDEIFSGMPESAKIEANEAIRQYKRLDDNRRRVLADAPKTAEALKKADMQRQYQYLNQQREEMKSMWDDAGKFLRDEAKLEVMQRSTDPDSKWWNEMGESADEQGRKLFLENTDMKKVALALRLAPYAEVYRNLWLSERKARTKNDGILKDKFGSEPSMSESGGNVRNGMDNPAEDLKKPFTDVFLREFHKAQSQGAR